MAKKEEKAKPKMAKEQPQPKIAEGQPQERPFPYATLIAGGVIGAGIISGIWYLTSRGARPPAEEAAREFFLGQKPVAKYKLAKDEILITSYGIEGLNRNRPGEVLIPGPDTNNDGLPDNIGKRVITDAEGEEIKTAAEANRRIGSLGELTIKIKPVYQQIPEDPNSTR